jgi:hypothetical protein
LDKSLFLFFSSLIFSGIFQARKRVKESFDIDWISVNNEKMEERKKRRRTGRQQVIGLALEIKQVT